jgi:hypothetical protein
MVAGKADGGRRGWWGQTRLVGAGEVNSVLNRPVRPSKGKTETVPSVRVRTETDGKDGRQLGFHRPRSSMVDIHGSFVKYIIIFI